MGTIVSDCFREMNDQDRQREVRRILRFDHQERAATIGVLSLLTDAQKKARDEERRL